jgi:hypothetical protein
MFPNGDQTGTAADGKPATVTKTTPQNGNKGKAQAPEWTEASAIAKVKDQKTLAGLNTVRPHDGLLE